MRAVFKMNLSVGLLNIPVKAIKVRDEQTISFKEVCPEGHRIKHRRFCEVCNKEYQYAELKKGFELGDELVVLDKEVIDAIKNIEKKAEFLGIVENNIDTRLIDTPYYLVPEKKEYAKVYNVLKEALSLANKNILIKYVARNRERIGIVKPYKNLLMLVSLYYIEDLREMPDVPESKVSKEEVDLAMQLINKLAEKEVKLDEIRDSYRQKVEEIVSAKLMGKEMPVIKVEQKQEDNLADVLKKSLEVVA